MSNQIKYPYVSADGDIHVSSKRQTIVIDEDSTSKKAFVALISSEFCGGRPTIMTFSSKDEFIGLGFDEDDWGKVKDLSVDEQVEADCMEGGVVYRRLA